ncbi:MAG: mannose-1-phosphate guanylyltransferase [Prolixibacteraceae bacterium]
MTNNYLIIMAGGVGSRFWPMSTTQKPKQFLDILNVGKTMLQQTVDRFRNCCHMNNVFVVTSESYKVLVKEQIPELDDAQVLLEPCMRNTAPCIAYAVWKIKKRNPNANIVVSPSDHMVLNLNEFDRVIEEGLAFTANRDVLLTLGMKPHKPETGFGYIKQEVNNELHSNTSSIKKVEAFREKPTYTIAQDYLADGNYFWNAGIFLWSVKSIEKAIRTFLPELASIFDNMEPQLDSANEQETIRQLFPTCPNISVDYGIMEHATNIYVSPSDFGWSDMGTWGSLHELSEKTEDANVLKGNIATFETNETIIRIEGNKKVVVQGLSGYIVVETTDALLICKRDQEQRIKEFQKGL